MAGVPLRGRTDAIPPQVLLLVGMAAVQFGAAFANTLFDKAGPAGVVLLRLTFAALLLLALARPRLSGRSRADLLAAAAFGLVLACMNWSFYESLHRLPLGVAVTVEFLGPLGVAVAGSRRLLDLVWVLLAGGGVTLLALGGSREKLNLAGLLLAALAGALWAAYILLSQRVGSAFAGLDGLAIAMTLATVVMIPVGVVQGGSALLRPDVLFGGFWVAMLSSLIPYSLEIISLRRLTASDFGLLMSLEPAVAALAGMLVLGQQPQLRTVLAIAMVVVASAGTTLEAARAATGTAAGTGPEAATRDGPAPEGPASSADRQPTPLG
jgi:inner membrane transporter RhtA